MRSNRDGINRRVFLKQSALAGVSLIANATWPRASYSANAERLIFYLASV
jgi:hypothetical protein